MLYILHNVICQLYLNKARKEIKQEPPENQNVGYLTKLFGGSSLLIYQNRLGNMFK